MAAAVQCGVLKSKGRQKTILFLKGESMEIRFYAISDACIAKLFSVDKRVLSNHENDRKHTRPYIGFLIKLDNYNYFLPLSSEDPKDYDKHGKLRLSTQTILRMKNKKGDFLGKILLNNMIPVPDSEIQEISLNKEALTLNKKTDSHIIKENKYKDLLIDELNWIKENILEITRKAKRLYSAKINENNKTYWEGREKPKFLEATVDFKKLEASVTMEYAKSKL